MKKHVTTFLTLFTIALAYGQDGSAPMDLIEVTPGEIVGTTYLGGETGAGVIYKYNINQNLYQVAAQFNCQNTGCNPGAKLMIASDKNIYGIANNGGMNGNGTIYSYNSETTELNNLVDFNGATANANYINGRATYGALVENIPGIFTGITGAGGINNYGSVFNYNFQTDEFTAPLYSFSAPSGWGSTYPANPKTALTRGANGKYYGLSYLGGSVNMGTLYEYDVNTNTAAVKYSFDINSGTSPTSSLVNGRDGDLWGTTSDWGSGCATCEDGMGWGTLFKYNVYSNTFTKVHNFVPGYSSPSEIIYAPNKKIYGYAHNPYNGILYEFNTLTSTYNVLKTFQSPLDGKYLNKLILASDRKIYGTTSGGGENDGGTLFSYKITTGEFSVVHHFAANPSIPYYKTIGIGEHEGTRSQINTTDEINYNVYSESSETIIVNTNGLTPINATIIFYNNMGQQMLEQKLTNYTNTLNTASFASGIYYYSITNDKSIKNGKIFVK